MIEGMCKGCSGRGFVAVEGDYVECARCWGTGEYRPIKEIVCRVIDRIVEERQHRAGRGRGE